MFNCLCIHLQNFFCCAEVGENTYGAWISCIWYVVTSILKLCTSRWVFNPRPHLPHPTLIIGRKGHLSQRSMKSIEFVDIWTWFPIWGIISKWFRNDGINSWHLENLEKVHDAGIKDRMTVWSIEKICTSSPFTWLVMRSGKFWSCSQVLVMLSIENMYEICDHCICQNCWGTSCGLAI